MDARQKKILLLGCSGFDGEDGNARLTCVAWHQIRQDLNIRDFDLVIISTLGITPQQKSQINWATFFAVLTPSVARDVVMHGGKFVVLGDPTFCVETASGNFAFLFWTGMQFIWDVGMGDTNFFLEDAANKPYRDYCSRIKRWQYSLRECNVHDGARRAAAALVPDSSRLHVRSRPIAVNRHKNALASAISVWTSAASKADIIFSFLLLPPIDLTEEETILLVLRDICGFSRLTPQPAWIANRVAPGQPLIDGRISELQTKIATFQQRLAEAEEERDRVRYCLKLLYAKDLELEGVVHEILERLGASVEKPTEPNKEDGWITVTTTMGELAGVLEIKSTGKDQFSEYGIKQLNEWKSRGIVNRKKHYKAIFIGSNAVLSPPPERPTALSDSFNTVAVMSQVCVVLTHDLFAIYEAHVNKALDPNIFWQDIFRTDGLFSAEKHLQAQSKTATSPAGKL